MTHARSTKALQQARFFSQRKTMHLNLLIVLKKRATRFRSLEGIRSMALARPRDGFCLVWATAPGRCAVKARRWASQPAFAMTRPPKPLCQSARSGQWPQRPGAGSKRIRGPKASTAAWILVVRPPRERQIPAASAPPFLRGRVGVHFADRGIDQHIIKVRIGAQRLEKVLPYSGQGPASEPGIHHAPVGQIRPQVARGTGAHSIHKTAFTTSRLSELFRPPPPFCREPEDR